MEIPASDDVVAELLVQPGATIYLGLQSVFLILVGNGPVKWHNNPTKATGKETADRRFPTGWFGVTRMMK